MEEFIEFFNDFSNVEDKTEIIVYKYPGVYETWIYKDTNLDTNKIIDNFIK